MQNCFDHIAATLIAGGVTDAVICPGSRNAPLIIALNRSERIHCHAIADERSAAFVALGIALGSQKPVVICCTSGSALANFYPAVIEAFYQQVPLIILTADRPAALIGQWDGQTIIQKNFFGAHVLGYWETPEDYSSPESFAKKTQEAVVTSMGMIPGPVHINVPIQEPFYPSPTHLFQASKAPYFIERKTIQTDSFDLDAIRGKKVLIVSGMRQQPAKALPHNLAVFYDVRSMVEGINNSVSELLFMSKVPELLDRLKPDILISDGRAILSKSVKQFIRQNKPQKHFHFSKEGDIADPFQTNPILVRLNLEEIAEALLEAQDGKYAKTLFMLSDEARSHFSNFINQNSWNEFTVVNRCFNFIPSQAVLHAANSMSVRYLAYCEPLNKGHLVHSNRGASGIDGCLSTALGFQYAHKGINYLFIGDVAFFYDSNAFWNAFAEEPLKVILLNNRGGGIFRLIEGPSNQPERKVFMETSHSRTADYLCRNLGIQYQSAENFHELEEGMNFLNNSLKPAVLEVFTDPDTNQIFFNQFKSKFNGV